MYAAHQSATKVFYTIRVKKTDKYEKLDFGYYCLSG
jgi:hypothetical protein